MVNFSSEIPKKKFYDADNDSLHSDKFRELRGDKKSLKVIVIMLIGVGLIGALGWFYMTFDNSKTQSTAEKKKNIFKFNLDHYNHGRQSRSVRAHVNDDTTSNSIEDEQVMEMIDQLFEPDPKDMILYTEKQQNEIKKVSIPHELSRAIREDENRTLLSSKLTIYVGNQHNQWRNFHEDVENITTTYQYDARTHPTNISKPSLVNLKIKYEPELKFLGSLLFGNLSSILVGEVKSVQQEIIGIYSNVMNNMDYIKVGEPLLILTFKSNVNSWLYYFRSVSNAKIIKYNDDIKNRMFLNNTKYGIYNTSAIVMTYDEMKYANENIPLFKSMKFNFVVYDLNDLNESEESLKSAYLTLNQLSDARSKIILLNTFDDHKMYLYKYIYMSMWSSVYKKKSSVYKQYLENCERKCYNEKLNKLNESSWCTDFDIQETKEEIKILKSFTIHTDPIIYNQSYPIHDERAVYCKLSPKQKQYYQLLERSIDADIITNKFNFLKAIKTTKSLRALANHALSTRNYWNNELVEYAIFQVEINNMVKHSRTKQLRSIDYASMSDIDINRLFTPYKYLDSLLLKDDSILDGSGKFDKLNELLPALSLRRHKISIFCEQSDVYLIERYLSIKEYKFVKLDNKTTKDNEEAIIDKFNGDTSIIIVPFVDICKEFSVDLSAVDTVIMYSVTFHDKYLKTINNCYHLGEKKPVIIERLIAEDTIEQYIYQNKLKDLQDFQENVFGNVN